MNKLTVQELEQLERYIIITSPNCLHKVSDEDYNKAFSIFQKLSYNYRTTIALIFKCLDIFHWYRLPVKLLDYTEDTIKFHSDIKCSLSTISDLRPIAEEHNIVIYLNDLEIEPN